ncbi:MAG: type II toxin-antitoxin system RelE/ParE family toxin [Betaproteobacteria bacterium]|jgi:mRNA interferase RelE/StbE|nr:type II toxin-antitoxin system RelE/ParE family toxin [Betaproteobacteria bacterium]MBK8317707.1 type II toxin-antitoxin system RelE/ParE family toxin [Betaproteobacteria bacterium]MBK9785563.1 type II toxin-antitoxin system RelE/ParE family toxin [Candidatus Dechloromonas phosphorivorans]
MYQIEYTRDAVKALKAMPRNMSLQIRGKIELLAADPFAANNNVRKLVGREAYRLRVGDWRVIYEFEGGRLVIHILTVAPRGGVYQ